MLVFAEACCMSMEPFFEDRNTLGQADVTCKSKMVLHEHPGQQASPTLMHVNLQLLIEIQARPVNI